jgi:putative ABC transport system permease protein
MLTRSANWLDTVWRDIRHALRVFRRSPRFTLTAVALLILGIGSTTAIFSITYAVLVRPLPYPNADRLMFLAERNGGGVAWPNFEDWQRRATSFDALAASLADGVIVTSGPVPRRLESRSVTSTFFHVLGASPFRGRLFDAADARPGAAKTVVVSHAFWVRELGGEPEAVGRTTVLNRNPFTIVGVLPPGFRYLTPADVYVLLEPQVAANYRGMQSRRTRTTLFAVGRLKPEVTAATARTEMQAIQAALTQEYPQDNTTSAVHLVTLTDRIIGEIAPTMTVLAGAVTLLLLIACVNLATLLLNKSASRAQEFGIRAAIGGSRWTLVRQLLIEHGLLVVAGGVLGAAAGGVLLSALVGVAPRDLPRLEEIQLDLVVLGLTTVFSCACVFALGIMPALKAAGLGGQAIVLRAGRGSTRSTSAMRRGFMMAEIAVAMVLLSGAGLMVHSMMRLARVDPGFDPRHLQAFSFSLTGPQWPDARKQAFFDSIVDRLRTVPGVENAAITYSLPILGSNWWNVFMIEGTTEAQWISVGLFPNAGMVPVTAGYFETLRIPLVQGRYFERSDRPESVPVAIITRSLAKKYWPNDDAVGKQIRQGFPKDPYGPWRTIVGVVGDLKQEGVDRDTPFQVFMPIVQQPRTTSYAIVRTRGPVSASSLESALHDLDRSIPVFNDRTLEQVMREASSRRRIAMLVLSVFGAVAVLLAAIGLYGVIAQSVTERRQEIGVRMALGASPRQILRLFLQHGLAVVAVGVGCGIAGSLAAARSLASLVFGVTVTDPMTLGGMSGLLLAITLLACYLPARSATRVDPLEALRTE